MGVTVHLTPGAVSHMAKLLHAIPPDSPNGRAAALNKIAASGGTDGLSEKEMQYVRWIRYIYRQYKRGKMCADEAKQWQILMQEQFLQRPI